MMSNIPEKLQYTKTHEWIRIDDELLTIGITDHAQTMLGDLVYIELPEVETSFDLGQECVVVESVKAAADVFCPVAGEVVEINEILIENPHLINNDPYGDGWLIRIRPFDKSKIQLLSAAEYSKLVASEAH
jgi:glycine cleavage system H protein